MEKHTFAKMDVTENSVKQTEQILFKVYRFTWSTSSLT